MICTDCKGTGKYVSLLSTEDCRRCQGSGKLTEEIEKVFVGAETKIQYSVDEGGFATAHEVSVDEVELQSSANLITGEAGFAWLAPQVAGDTSELSHKGALISERLFRNWKSYDPGRHKLVWVRDGNWTKLVVDGVKFPLFHTLTTDAEPIETARARLATKFDKYYGL